MTSAMESARRRGGSNRAKGRARVSITLIISDSWVVMVTKFAAATAASIRKITTAPPETSSSHRCQTATTNTKGQSGRNIRSAVWKKSGPPLATNATMAKNAIAKDCGVVRANSTTVPALRHRSLAHAGWRCAQVGTGEVSVNIA